MMEDPPDVTRNNITGRWVSDDIIELEKRYLGGIIGPHFLIVSIADLEEIIKELRKQEQPE